MHRRAAGELDLDLARSWYVGDKASDVLPGLELGGRGILVRTGYGQEAERAVPGGVLVADDLTDAVARILGAPAEPPRSPGGVDPLLGSG